MKKSLKKLVSTVVLSAVCITTVIAPATASASEVSTEIGVTAAATMLDVTITPAVSIPIDPADNSIPSATITVVNNTVAPVTVTLASLTAAEGSAFALVAPDAFTNWDSLNKADSLNVALRLTPSSFPASTGVFYSGAGQFFTGTLDANTSGSFNVAVYKHGKAFDDVKTAKFNIDFVVALA